MAYSYNIEEIPPDDVPCVEHDIRRAKKFLQKHSPESGDSLYDHLTEVLTKILAERPRNAADVFEEYSRRVREGRFKTRNDYLRDVYVPPAQYEAAKKLIKLFQTVQQREKDEGGRIVDEEREEDEEDEKRRKKPDMLDLLFYFERTNIGLPRSEMVLLNLAIRKLMSSLPLENVRFWGKILGSPKNYYVVEADLQEEELNRRLAKMEEEEEVKRRNADAEHREKAEVDEDDTTKVEKEPDAVAVPTTDITVTEKREEGLELVFPSLPVNSWKQPPDVPPERIGSGANKKVYFVCNAPGLDEWIELPPVTPQQIVIARQIVRYCTGNLDTPFHTFPPFPGTERNYLRAQIARISAATLVSPIGFFTFGDEDEEEEIGEETVEGGILSENAHYDPLPVKDLVDPSMSNWCHHSPYILKQGRVEWWNPKQGEEDVDDEAGVEEEEEEEIGEDETGTTTKEVGPPLLTPLSEDATLDSITPWTAVQSSHVQSDLAVALVRSNTWPGAFAFASGKRFANLYVGWAQKYVAFNYSPPSMPPVQDQYPIGPEIMEIRDPTFEEEEAYRIAHLPPPPVFPMGEEEGEFLGEVEEEEEEEEDE